MKTIRGFEVMSDRYKFDYQLTTSKGWAQVDTRNDASYFGTWCNPFELQIFQFIEGDTVLTDCDTVEEFLEELNKFKEFYGDGFRGIDPGWPGQPACDKLTVRFEAMGLGEMLH